MQNVASETLEGLRKETRTGLEYALQTHKTIDIQMDMNAPIIIIPEECDFFSISQSQFQSDTFLEA